MKIVDARVHIRSKTVVPNVAVKATGAPHYSTQPYPFRNIRDGLHRIFDAIGPKRMFWGTDITRNALQLSSMRDLIHGGVALAQRQRP